MTKACKKEIMKRSGLMNNANKAWPNKTGSETEVMNNKGKKAC